MRLPTREVRGTVFPPTLHEAHRRPLGLEPAALLAILGALTLFGAVAAAVAGAWVLTILLLGVALGLAALFLAAIGREPGTPLARATMRALSRAAAARRLAWVASAAWMRGSVALSVASIRRARLRRELRRQLVPLGEAVHTGDQERAAAAKAHADRVEMAIREADRGQRAARADIRHAIDRERAGAQATGVMPAAAASSSSRSTATQPPADRARA